MNGKKNENKRWVGASRAESSPVIGDGAWRLVKKPKAQLYVAKTFSVSVAINGDERHNRGAERKKSIVIAN